MFIIVADEEQEAEGATVASQLVLKLRGRTSRRLDFASNQSRAAIEDALSSMMHKGADTAVLSGMQDGEDYDVSWRPLISNWQVLVRVDEASALSLLENHRNAAWLEADIR